MPSGDKIQYGLNDNRRVSYVSAMVDGSTLLLASAVTYAPFGPVTGLTYDNGLTLSATYDED